jgi:hypothetical protein
MARYRKLDLRTWNDKKFRALSPLPPSGQSLWLYLVLGPHTTSIPGLFEASENSMADRLGWSLKAFREAFREASSKALAKADWEARLVWLPKAPEYNRPESPNVVISWGAAFDELPECPIKWQAHQSLKAFTEGLGEAFSKAFAKAIPKAMPNQEQEQEQEQDREGNGLNGHSREKTSKPKPSKRAPTDFTPDREFALAELPDIDVDTEIAKLRDWEFKTPRSDWSAVWRTWIRNAKTNGKYARKPGSDNAWH